MKLVPFLSDSSDPRGSVLLAHGFGEHYRRYQNFIDTLQREGYDVWTFDFTGHGEAPGKRGQVDVAKLIEEHLQARRRFEAEARTEDGFLFGHSMGGLVTLASTLLDPSHLRGTAVTGPALRPLPELPWIAARVASVGSRFAPGLPTVAIDVDTLSRDPAVVAAYREDPLVFQDKVPLITASSMVEQGRRVIKNAPMLTVPALLMHGSADALTSPEGSAEFVERARGRAELSIVPGGYHELLNEPDREEHAHKLLQWFNQR